MELKPTYNKYGEQRAYYIGKDGEEYFMYQDERTGYIIREMNKEDVQTWYDTMEIGKNRHQTPIERAIDMAKVSQQVEKMIGESLEKTMLVLNPKNEIIGELDFTEKDGVKAELQIFLRDEKTVKLKGFKVIELIKRMNISERLYDEIWTENTNHNMMRII